MSTVTIDALDAIELADILEYFLERVDPLGEHNLRLAVPLRRRR